MAKRYAPDVPDSRWHRPGDTAYLRELLAAAGLSQRKAGPLIGMNERTMRLKASGDNPLTYPEQYCLEVLADKARSIAADAVRDAAPPARVGTVWHQREHRPITAADAGKMIVARDRIGSSIFGTIHVDEFGPVIRHNGDIDAHTVLVQNVDVYALLDPPEEP